MKKHLLKLNDILKISKNTVLLEVFLIESKAKIRNANLKWKLNSILKSLVFIFSTVAIGGLGFILPAWLYHTYSKELLPILLKFLPLTILISYFIKAIVLKPKIISQTPYRLLPIRLSILTILFMIKSVLDILFILEFTFFYFFIQGIGEYNIITKWWLIFIILLFSIISLYAQLFRVAYMQWEHKYMYQKMLNYTVILFSFIILLVSFQRKTISKFIFEYIAFESF